jgi:hypothetical protein
MRNVVKGGLLAAALLAVCVVSAEYIDDDNDAIVVEGKA